ncbi:MAG: hypothetical protein R3F13_03430 [Prosthecobacter sp.]
MTSPSPDFLPPAHLSAVKSAGYRTIRWRNARNVLDRRVGKQRLSSGLNEFLNRWSRAVPPASESEGLRLQFGVSSERLFLQNGAALAESALERALLHLPALKSFWRQELRQDHYAALLSLVSKAWIHDPAEIPPGAVIQGLNTAEWPAPGEEGLHERDSVLSEIVTADLTFDAIYQMDEKGRVVLRSIEAAG